MPIHIVSPKAHPVAAPKPQPAEPVAPQLTRADVEQMLAQRDAQWAGQLAALAEAFSKSVATVAALTARKPNSSIKLIYDQRGAITGAEIVHKAPGR